MRHRAHLRELHASGKLRLAGEFADGAGFLEILEAKDRLEAERLARASPLIEDGLGSWTLRECNQACMSNQILLSSSR